MLIDVLDRNSDRPVSDLVRVIDKAWPKPKAPKPKKAQSAAPFDASIWVTRLRQAQSDGRAFQALLTELRKSKQLKGPDITAIANGFRSTTKKYKSKAAAVEDIRKAWMEGLRDAEKVRKVSGIF